MDKDKIFKILSKYTNVKKYIPKKVYESPKNILYILETSQPFLNDRDVLIADTHTNGNTRPLSALIQLCCKYKMEFIIL